MVPDQLPFASIIILTYNGSGYIVSLLESIQDQTYPSDKYEVFVADNNSNDTTVELVRQQFPEVRIIELSENLGFAGGCNEALKHVTGQYAVFVNQDTICHRRWLEGLLVCLMTKPHVAVSVSNMIFSSPERIKDIDREVDVDSISYFDLSFFGYGIYRQRQGLKEVYPRIFSGCSFALRLSVLNENFRYLFDDRLKMYAEDTEMSLRLYNAGYRICAVRDSVIYHLHSSHLGLDLARIKIAANAVINRVLAFFVNMTIFEFMLYYPVLLLGGIFKIFSLRITAFKKIILFLPFGIFSILCMLMSVLKFREFNSQRKRNIEKRKQSGFALLKYILMSG